VYFVEIAEGEVDGKRLKVDRRDDNGRFRSVKLYRVEGIRKEIRKLNSDVTSDVLDSC
jgi:hypothetical protein